MSKKLMLLALAAVSAVMFVLPAVASAGVWELKPASGKFPQTFTNASIGNTILTTDESSLKVTCTKATGTGEYENATTGKNLTLTFSGCTENLFGSSCTNEVGGILTTDLTFHNIMLEKTGAVGFPNGTPGILITANAGHFATFSCGGGLVKVAVNGNGIVGDIVNECGSTTKSTTLKFESVATGTQKWTKITTEGTVFDLTSSQNGGAAKTASQDGEGTSTFLENETIVCP
jgi:hypothetical protein